MATINCSLLSQEKLDQLPKDFFFDSRFIYQYEGFWYRQEMLNGLLAFRSHFEPRSDDVILATSMKTGTTWLKALCTCILGCQNNATDHDVGGEVDELEVKNPHDCVWTLELLYSLPDSKYIVDCLSGMQSPRLFHTHLSYNALTDSIKKSDCKIVYLVRNPKDVLVSSWHFFNKHFRPNQDPYPFEKACDTFCKGIHPFGPYHDHCLQYWFESLKLPNKILFLKYEDLQRDAKGQVKRLAEFLGRPFVNEDEVDKVLWKSNIDRLKNLEVNKYGVFSGPGISLPNSSFFRRGVVGDWKNYLSTEVKQNLDEITRKKLEGSGLDLEA